VSDGLDNLLEDLSGLNRVIVNADPIPASTDKLKDDLEENKVNSKLSYISKMVGFLSYHDFCNNRNVHYFYDILFLPIRLL
jgi:hypothetical protein